MPIQSSPESAPAELRDKRVAPPGVLPKNVQAIVLMIIALVMVLVIAFSGRNAPKEKTQPQAVPPRPTEPNAAQIRAYETQLKAELQQLETAKSQFSSAQRAMGLTGTPLPTSAAGLPLSAYRPSGLLPAAEPGSGLSQDIRDREARSLFADNVALTFRSAPAPSAPAPPTAADMVAKALSAYAPTSPPAATAPVPAKPAEAASPEKPHPASRDDSLSRATGKRYWLFEGTVIESVLTNRLDSSFSGPVNCMVTTSVYSHNGRHVLIPEGSRVLGEARKVETFGETRLAVVFHRLIMPDGYSVSLDKFKGLNQIGATGLHDQVNHHYFQVFGVSLALGAIAGFSQVNTSYGIGESSADAYRQGAASSLAQSSAHILDRYLNILPTITVREGHRVKVYLSGDLLLPAYDNHQMPSDL